MSGEDHTPETFEDALGLRLLRWGIDVASELDENLRQSGDVLVRKDEGTFRLELLIFALFPVDGLVQREFEEESGDVRRAMRRWLDRMARELSEIPSPEGQPKNSFNELVGDRFEEYNQAFGFDRRMEHEIQRQEAVRHNVYVPDSPKAGEACALMRTLPPPQSTAQS